MCISGICKVCKLAVLKYLLIYIYCVFYHSKCCVCRPQLRCELPIDKSYKVGQEINAVLEKLNSKRNYQEYEIKKLNI